LPPACCCLRTCTDRKLLLVVRHGQAISNYLSDLLGPDEWFKVEGTCQYDDRQGMVYNVFDAGACVYVPRYVVLTTHRKRHRACCWTTSPDPAECCEPQSGHAGVCLIAACHPPAAAAADADLTGTGHDQAVSLQTMLGGGGWFSKMTGGKPVRAIISPLTRYETAVNTSRAKLWWCVADFPTLLGCWPERFSSLHHLPRLCWHKTAQPSLPLCPLLTRQSEASMRQRACNLAGAPCSALAAADCVAVPAVANCV
jgi:hypothetical protein